MHPVGPNSVQTYWLRRTLVAVVAIALVAGVVWWALGRGSGSGPDNAASTTTETTTTPLLTGVLAADSATDTADESAASSDDPFATDSTTGSEAAMEADSSASTSHTTAASTAPTTTAPAGGAVTSSSTEDAAQAAADTTPAPGTTLAGATVVQTTVPAPVTVTVTKHVPATVTATKPTAPKTTAPPKPSYDSAGRLICPAASISVTGVVWGTVAGQQPRLGMNVTNIGKQGCQQDVSGAAQIYTVFTTAGERIWSTADCFPGEGHEVRGLAPGHRASFVIVWSGTTSEPGCAAPRVKVKPGTYKLVVQLGALKSKTLPFTMH